MENETQRVRAEPPNDTMSKTTPSDVIGQLRVTLATLDKTSAPGGTVLEQIVKPREGVFARFGPVFRPEHLPELTEEEFRSFLIFENNCHWTGLHRQGSRMCQDMPALRQALHGLLDDERPIDARLDETISRIYGMGKATATGILLIAYPDRYGVWNRISESAMQKLGLWPEFERGATVGERYVKVNQALLRLRDALDIDLWTLDALWWAVLQEGTEEGEAPKPGQTLVAEGGQAFGLERHLHEFLMDNWDHLELGQEWNVYEEDGQPDAGYEFVCPVGRIDILAKHRREPRWLVVELKRSNSSDQTVGQALRYIGWVRNHLAKPGEEVQGLIISHEADDAIRYALSTVPFIDLRLYEVEFHLKLAPNVPSAGGAEAPQ